MSTDAEEFDKTEVFKRWADAGVAPSAMERLWELAAVVRENDKIMDQITALDDDRSRAEFVFTWTKWGVHPTAVSYMAQQRIMRMESATGLELSDDMRRAMMITWMDGLAAGLNSKKGFQPFFPPLDGSTRSS